MKSHKPLVYISIQLHSLTTKASVEMADADDDWSDVEADDTPSGSDHAGHDAESGGGETCEAKRTPRKARSHRDDGGAGRQLADGEGKCWG